MSPSVALSYNCKSLEKDPTPVAALTVSCAYCDPDNPLAVTQRKCVVCKGSGQAPVALGAIVTEIHTSRLELLRGGKD